MLRLRVSIATALLFLRTARQADADSWERFLIWRCLRIGVLSVRQVSRATVCASQLARSRHARSRPTHQTIFVASGGPRLIVHVASRRDSGVPWSEWIG